MKKREKKQAQVQGEKVKRNGICARESRVFSSARNIKEMRRENTKGRWGEQLAKKNKDRVQELQNRKQCDSEQSAAIKETPPLNPHLITYLGWQIMMSYSAH